MIVGNLRNVQSGNRFLRYTLRNFLNQSCVVRFCTLQEIAIQLLMFGVAVVD